MTYEVKWSENSLRQLEKLNKSVAKRVIEKVASISERPFNFVKRLEGFKLFSLRIGDYRAIMSIENKVLLIFVLEVGHRSVVYRKY